MSSRQRGLGKYLLISCTVFYREISSLVARSRHQIDLTFLPKGLHNIGCVGMRERLQQKLDSLDDSPYEAVLWGYGICNHGLVGLEARSRPIVIPRAHDCITIFFGSRKRHEEYARENPDAFYQTPGWIEREENEEWLNQLSISNRLGMEESYETLVEKYGEENATYIFEQLHGENRHRRKITYLDTEVADDDRFASLAREKAQSKDWDFERLKGNLTMLERLVNGDWDPVDFLVVEPGHRVVATYDETLIRAEPIPDAEKR